MTSTDNKCDWCTDVLLDTEKEYPQAVVKEYHADASIGTFHVMCWQAMTEEVYWDEMGKSQERYG